MAHITIKELENNLIYYLELSNKEDIFVEKDGEDISVFVSPDRYRMDLIEKIRGSFGTINEDIDYDEVLREAIMKKHMHR